ncbi:MAG: hypothetical protein ACYDAG_14960 [Chloroflexota bacterium]
MAERRSRATGLARLLLERPELAGRYRVMRAYRGVSQARQYDLTERCNLRCPGCYFFAWEDNGRRSSQRTLDGWRSYFQRERDGGVLLGHLAGAEPALVPRLLALAAETFPECVVYTNGIVPIDRGLRQVRIHVSLWGGAAYHDRAKGAPSWAKIFRNYRDDRRVLLVYTIDRDNIAGIEDSVKAAADLGVDGITFNLLQFSPLSLTLPEGRGLPAPEADYERLRDLLHRLRDQYGHFVVFPHRYNDLVVRSGCYVKFRDCVLRQSVRAVKVDGSYADGRCCYWEAAHQFEGWDRECECSGYAVTWSQAVRNLAQGSSSDADARDFLDVYDGFLRIFSARYARGEPPASPAEGKRRVIGEVAAPGG